MKLKTKHILNSLIRNTKQIKQVIDFTGLQNGKIHPTDIDSVLEFDNEVLILIEVKYKYSKIPTGQKLVLERICDSWHTNKSIVLYVEHNHVNDNENIPLHKCYVKNIYYKKQWQERKSVLLLNFLNNLGEYWDCEKLKFQTI
jgi:hypothetical protein|tara:strand:- start:387 stop:815 length:429 start_codon:yes stop_codon:yes gene_type:complete